MNRVMPNVTQRRTRGTPLLAPLFAPLLAAVALGLAVAPSDVPARDTAAQDLRSAEAEARAQGVAPPGMPCGDFLQALGRKPAHVEYLGCELHDDRQAKPMIARYQVIGAHAAAAHAQLSEAFGLPPLLYVCCGWETAPHSWRGGQDGLQYGLGMGVETPRYPSDEWGRIPAFSITVTLYTDVI